MHERSERVRISNAEKEPLWADEVLHVVVAHAAGHSSPTPPPVNRFEQCAAVRARRGAGLFDSTLSLFVLARDLFVLAQSS